MSDFHLLMLTKHWPKQILGVSFFFEHWLWSPERCQDRPIYKKQKSACKKLWCRSLWDEVRDDWQDGNTTSSSTLKPVSWFLLKVCSFFFAQKQCSRKGSSYASKGGKKSKFSAFLTLHLLSDIKLEIIKCWSVLLYFLVIQFPTICRNLITPVIPTITETPPILHSFSAVTPWVIAKSATTEI